MHNGSGVGSLINEAKDLTVTERLTLWHYDSEFQLQNLQISCETKMVP